jgi:FkbM family methyltransferase
MRILKALVRAYHVLPLGPLRPALRAAGRKLTARRKRIVRSDDGLLYELELDEFIDREIYMHGCFEPDTTRAIQHFVKPGMTVFDVGANIGAHTCLFAKHVGEHGKVIAFEPMPWALAKMKRNLALNNFRNVSIENRALSDENGKFELHFRSSWKLGAARSTEHRDSLEPIAVDLITLDELSEPRLDFLKVDVDGFELKVFRGAVRTLKTLRPTVITELGENAGEIIDLLKSCGYGFLHEKTLTRCVSLEDLLKSIPHDGTINLVCRYVG